MKISKHIEQLIDALFDFSVDLGTRDDIASELYRYNAIEVEEALINLCSSERFDDLLIDTGGESLGQIWKRKKKFDEDVFAILLPVAQDHVLMFAKEFRKGS